MKHTKKFTAALLALLLTLSIIPFHAAAAENTPKEEVVYVNLNGDGTVSQINVVNIFDLETAGQIVDFGSYESLRNMTTTDQIHYSSNKVTINAQPGRLYYEGKLTSHVIPWNISIHYYMDGKEYTADNIGGMSGDLKITLEITENTAYTGNFFDGFALQTTLSLDTKKCSNISAPGATIANVGSKKQLTYTILPGRGADIAITANVNNFEMDAISINGIALELDIKINDDTIQEKIDALLSGCGKLDEGAGAIKDGASQLLEGTTALKDGTSQLEIGTGALLSGTEQLSTGLNTIKSKNKELMDGAWKVFEGLCSAAETVINASLSQYGLDTIDLTPNNYDKVLKEVLDSMDASEIYDLAYEMALKTVTEQVNAREAELYAGYIASIADSVYLTYLQSQAETLYAQVAADIIFEQLLSYGYSEEDAAAYLQTKKGKELIQTTVGYMTEEQKEQIIQAALGHLTEEQKQQIREGAVKALTDDQKNQIKQGYIDQTMKSQEVADQITAAVAAADTAAASVTALKGQLDSYSLFYDGLTDYTDAVSEAAKGANTLKMNMEKLHESVGTLNTSVGQLSDGVQTLVNGATEMKDGTSEFVNQASGADEMISGVINSIISSISGGDEALTSFVSEENANVEAVQFVIKTSAITANAELEEIPVVEEKLTFWQKLLRLFGLY